MNIHDVAGFPWTRVFLSEGDRVLDVERLLGIENSQATVGPEAFALRLVSPGGKGIRVDEVTILLREDRLVTVEPTRGAPLLEALGERLEREIGPASPYVICLALVQAGYASLGRSLGLIEADLRTTRQSMMADLGRDMPAVEGIGLSDLPQVGRLLTSIDEALSHASYAVGRLAGLARRVRQEVAGDPGINDSILEEVGLQAQTTARRLEFIVDRHRFHAQRAVQHISSSDLFVVKVFTLLWAILIPGTTLINWYGQNLKFMPELSSPYTPWAQLVGVFCLAALPIYAIKRAGQLR